MSEYWVSKKKYYCQYCEIYITDDAPSRSQHENGLRHRGNKDRFIRSLYKAGVKKKQDSEEEKREMQRVDEAARAAYARDIGAGWATPGASSSSAVPVTTPKPKAPMKPSDPYENYTTAASLGISDPDVERVVAEAKARRSEGRAGDWVAVVPPPPPLPRADEAAQGDDVKLEPGSTIGEVRKREEGPPENDDARHFKLRKKTVSVGLGEIYDPGVIQIKPRVPPTFKREETGPVPAPGSVLGGNVPQNSRNLQKLDAGSKATDKPTWTRREWKWAGEAGEDQPPQLENVDEAHSGRLLDMTTTSKEGADAVKPEDDNAEPQLESSNSFKNEEEDEPSLPSVESEGGSLFRKRKVPRATSSRGRRQV